MESQGFIRKLQVHRVVGAACACSRFVLVQYFVVCEDAYRITLLTSTAIAVADWYSRNDKGSHHGF